MSHVPQESEGPADPSDQPSSHDLAQASETVATASSRRPHGAPADEPLAVCGAPASRVLPDSYERDYLRAVQRGPNQIAVFWDADPETAQRLATGRWGLVVRTADGVRHVDVRYGARCWYVDVASAAGACVVEFGPLDDADNITPVATASVGRTEIGPATSHQASENVWGNGTLHEGAMRFLAARHHEPTADTDALIQDCRAAAGSSPAAHSWPLR